VASRSEQGTHWSEPLATRRMPRRHALASAPVHSPITWLQVSYHVQDTCRRDRLAVLLRQYVSVGATVSPFQKSSPLSAQGRRAHLRSQAHVPPYIPTIQGCRSSSNSQKPNLPCEHSFTLRTMCGSRTGGW
jgi:hypothetical protein